MIAQIARAVVFAMATVANRSGFRASRALILGYAALGWCRLRRPREVMPTISSRRRYWPPISEMRASVTGPGVNPS